jgi:hypothetical protein
MNIAHLLIGFFIFAPMRLSFILTACLKEPKAGNAPDVISNAFTAFSRPSTSSSRDGAYLSSTNSC